MLEAWIWTQNQCFEAWGIIWDNFKKPQIDLNAKNWVQELNVVSTLEIRNNVNRPNTLVFLTQQVDCRLSPYTSAANKINGLGYPKKGLKKDSIFG